MVPAIAIWGGFLASNNLLSRRKVFSAADASRRFHRNEAWNSMVAAADSMIVQISLDASELERDLERIESGEIELPTVSAVRVSCDGVFEQDVPIWLPEQ